MAALTEEESTIKLDPLPIDSLQDTDDLALLHRLHYH